MSNKRTVIKLTDEQFNAPLFETICVIDEITLKDFENEWKKYRIVADANDCKFKIETTETRLSLSGGWFASTKYECFWTADIFSEINGCWTSRTHEYLTFEDAENAVKHFINPHTARTIKQVYSI